jgi:hypothetical protein
MPRPLRRGRDLTPEQWQQATDNARLASRYKFAEARVRKIAAGTPALTPEMRAELARIILAPAGESA